MDCDSPEARFVTEPDLRRSFSSALVRLDVVKTTEDLDGRIAFDTVLLAQVGLDGTVNLGQGDVLLFQLCGSFFILWCQSLAVATPRRKEFCEHEVVSRDEVFE